METTLDLDDELVIAIDPNLLVYAPRASTPEHGAARRAIERVPGLTLHDPLQ
jgi:hypothetical protein